MSIRTIVVDDEGPARQRLRKLLKDFNEVEVVGEAADGEEAIERVAELKPDLLLLDIQMPVCGGLEVAASLPSPRPAIIFCTAFDEYAVEAFELNAVDYLLKPVSRVRLRSALEKVKARGEQVDERLDRVIQGRARRFLAKRGNRYCVIPVDEVLYFKSEEGLTQLVAGERSYWMQPTLTELEKRLDSASFFRVSRGALVNLGAVKEVAPLIGGHGQVLLSNGTRLDVSRRRFKGLLEHLSSV